MNSVVDLREPIHITGRWITEAEFARLHGLNRQTLTNWRYIDRKAGRTEAGTGYPVYPYFGRAIRYWLETPEQSLPLALKTMPRSTARTEIIIRASALF